MRTGDGLESEGLAGYFQLNIGVDLRWMVDGGLDFVPLIDWGLEFGRLRWTGFGFRSRRRLRPDGRTWEGEMLESG